jgi:tyrosine-protein kinase Etk/Wzc
MSKNVSKSEDNLFVFLVNKYLPFWPLFGALLVLALAGAWGYLHFMSVPTYEATAAIIIKDTKKGVEDSRMTRSMDAFISNNIVENETKVIQSRALMMQVVTDLGLYAPVYEEGKYKSVLAYTSSPIKVALQSPQQAREWEKVYFTFDPAREMVLVNRQNYPLNTWVKTPYGVMQFTRNDKRNRDATLPLYFSIIHPKRVTEGLVRKLTIETENKLSTALSLRVTDQVPERAEDILNRLIESYNQMGIASRNKLATNTLNFVEDRLQLVGKELEELEKKVVQYKSTKGVVDLSEQGKQFLSNAGENERSLADINLQLAVLANVEKYIVSRNITESIVPSTLGIKDPVLSQLVRQLYDSEMEYQGLRKITAENNPILLSLTDEIKSLRRSTLENVRNQRISLQTSRANMTVTKKQFHTALQSIPQKERELLDITRQQASKNEAYRFLLQKREEAVLSSAPNAANTEIVDQAQASLLPVSPKSLYIYIIAVMAAFGFGIAIITGKELLTSKILFRSEIEEQTTIPIVSELSFVKNNEELLFQAPTAAFTIEQFRQMRVTLGLYGRFFTKKKILVTSNIPGEGKSFVSTNLAYSLASSGKKVALLDFDLRNPNTSRLFNLFKQKGITEFLEEEAQMYEIINETAFHHLYLVPAGTNIGDRTELLFNGHIESLFALLEKEFDYIIIDTPPIDLVSDAYLISEYCDITLLVMRHAYTPKRIVQGLEKNRKLKSIQNLAIVFNGIKARGIFKKHHGYGYGYGHENNYGIRSYGDGALKTKA